MSIFDVIAGKESSGGKNLYNPVGTSSGHAEGWYGITTGTWNDFAPKAGVNLSQYPDPNSAPQPVQQQVAGQIPLSRWAPSTVSAVHAAYPGITDDSKTVGALAGTAPAQEGVYDPNTGNVTDPTTGKPTNNSLDLSLLNPVWEVVSRGLLIFCGFALVLIALAAMLFESKTVRTTIKRGAELAAV